MGVIMKGKYRKTLAIALAAILTIWALAGCSTGTNAEDSTQAESSESSTNEANASDTNSSDATGGTISSSETSGSDTAECLAAKDISAIYDDSDLDSSWDESSSVIIELGGNSIEASGSGVSISGSIATISQAGTYVLRGTLDDGQVIIDANEDAIVRLVLDGVVVASSTSAPIYGVKAEKVVIILADGSSNVITDAAEYVYEDETTDEPDSPIYVKDSLTINGTGALAVTGNYHNGITSKDNLCIVSGDITVTAVYNGIKGRDSLTVIGGNITVAAESDGLTANNDEDADKGWILIENGTFNISAANDGIQAETSLLIVDGVFNIETNGGSANGTTNGNENDMPEFSGGQGGSMTRPDGTTNNGEVMAIPEGGRGGNMTFETDEEGNAVTPSGADRGDLTMPEERTGDMSNMPPGDFGQETVTGESTAEGDIAGNDAADTTTVTTTGTDTTVSDSYKGLKSGSGIEIRGGVFDINSADDAIHSNGDITIEGGDFFIASGDDGVHSDLALVINGGTIDITESYEGLEGSSITVNDGTITLVSRDDGMNSAGGSDETTTTGGFMDKFGDSSNCDIEINGGFIMIDAAGDGVDANGTITMNDGVLIVYGPTNGGNGALDYDSAFNINGGIVAAAGSSGMALGASENGAQASVLLYYSETQAAGTLFSIESNTGESLLTIAPAKDYQSIVISTPEMATGSTYHIYSGGTDSGTNMNGYYTGGTYTPGTLVLKLTLESIATSISDTGEAVSGMGMGGGGRR